MIEFENYINRISPLDTPAMEEIIKYTNIEEYQKGDYILKSEKICNHCYFIKSGLVKLFFRKEEKEFIMTFFKENRMFNEISSYVTQQPSKYMIVALENTIVYSIHKKHIDSLSKTFHSVETLFSKLYAFATLGMMKRVSEMLEENATERYSIFIRENGELLQRISLGDLSSYLGISQVSLSRIRAKKTF